MWDSGFAVCCKGVRAGPWLLRLVGWRESAVGSGVWHRREGKVGDPGRRERWKKTANKAQVLSPSRGRAWQPGHREAWAVVREEGRTCGDAVGRPVALMETWEFLF